MKTALSLTLATSLSLAGVAFAQAPAPGSKTIKFKGEVTFLSDAPLEKISGTAEDVVGTVTTDPADFSKTTGTIVASVESIKTGSPIRDAHLKGESWLDGKSHPTLTFKISDVLVENVEQRGTILVAKGKVRGTFALRGVEAPLSARVTLKWKGNRVKARLSFVVKLADHRVPGQQGVLGKKVAETIEITGTLLGTVES